MHKQLEIYSVEGFGNFPTDMLRYDQAEYATDADRELAETSRKRRVVMLKGPRPTIGRWASFMWNVL